MRLGSGGRLQRGGWLAHHHEGTGGNASKHHHGRAAGGGGEGGEREGEGAMEESEEVAAWVHAKPHH